MDQLHAGISTNSPSRHSPQARPLAVRERQCSADRSRTIRDKFQARTLQLLAPRVGNIVKLRDRVMKCGDQEQRHPHTGGDCQHGQQSEASHPATAIQGITLVDYVCFTSLARARGRGQRVVPAITDHSTSPGRPLALAEWNNTAEKKSHCDHLLSSQFHPHSPSSCSEHRNQGQRQILFKSVCACTLEDTIAPG